MFRSQGVIVMSCVCATAANHRQTRKQCSVVFNCQFNQLTCHSSHLEHWFRTHLVALSHNFKGTVHLKNRRMVLFIHTDWFGVSCWVLVMSGTQSAKLIHFNKMQQRCLSRNQDPITEDYPHTLFWVVSWRKFFFFPELCQPTTVQPGSCSDEL